MPLRLFTMGAPTELHVDGAPRKFGNVKHLALLTYLVLEPSDYSRETLTSFVWSSGDAGSMNDALSALRAVFGVRVFPHRAARIQFDPTLIECDALDLLAARDDPDRREAALGQYRGPFLENFNERGASSRFVRWVETKRAELQEVFLLLCTRECETAAAEQQWQRVQEVAELGLRRVPTWEEGERWVALARAAPIPSVDDERATSVPEPSAVEVAVIAPAADPGQIQEASTSLEPITTVSDRLDEPATPLANPPVAHHRFPFGLVIGFVVGLVAAIVAVLILSSRSFDRDDVAATPPISGHDLPPAGSPITRLSDWLRTDGRWIYYRYEVYIPGACEHKTQAVGNWGVDGWSTGVPIFCLNEAWLAVDVEQLTRQFPLVPETTYCINFLYRENHTSFWGMHGPEDAPGLDSIRVVAPNGAYNIGFALRRQNSGRNQVVFTHEYPAPKC